MNNKKFLINPAMADSIWCPEPWQIIHYQNESRLNSFWVGFIGALVLLPQRILIEIFLAALFGKFKIAIFSLVFIPVSTIRWMVWGIQGRAFGLQIDLNTLQNARFMEPVEVAMAFVLGKNEPIMTQDEFARAALSTAKMPD